MSKSMKRIGTAVMAIMWIGMIILATETVGHTEANSGEHYSYEPFKIEVVDKETKRGIPLVELRTVHNVSYYTDSNGVIAFDEPGLMDQTVFFYIESHGYTFPEDDFWGWHGTGIEIVPGGEVTLEMERNNVAERLYRISGQGIYDHSMRLEMDVPIDHPGINSEVLGLDTVMATEYNDSIYWFWGDTHRASFPLGNFHATGAVSDLPENGGLNPEEGINLDFFTEDDGFVKPMVTHVEQGTLAWVDGVMTVPDEEGNERLVIGYASLADLVTVESRGLLLFDDEEEQFEKIASFEYEADDVEPWQIPRGQTTTYEEDGQEYYLFNFPVSLVRVPATLEAVQDQDQYEAFTPLVQGTEFEGGETALERDEDGNLVWDWKPDTDPLQQPEELELIEAGLMDADEAYYQFQDVDTGVAVDIQRGSVHWNEYRERWIMIGQERFGEASILGETWYAEAESPMGPWKDAHHIVTHDDYSFYNVAHHPFFDEDDGRVIYFEGTYTYEFTEEATPTPQYDYNQMMYRLDLDDLTLPPTNGDEETDPGDGDSDPENGGSENGDAELEELIEELKGQIEDLRNRIQEMDDNTQIEELEIEIQALMGEIDALMAEAENNELENELQGLESQLQDLKEELQKRSKKLEKEKEEHDPSELEEGDEKEDSVPGAGKGSSDKADRSGTGGALPITATPFYNYLIAGIVLLLIGAFILAKHRRKIAL